MTKTRFETNPEPNSRSSHHGRDVQDKPSGGSSSERQRHHVTSKRPQVNACTKSIPAPSENKPKEVLHKKPKKEMKPASKNRSNSSKSSERRKLSEGSTASDDLSKDSGCASGKLSSINSSSSEISDSSEEIKLTIDKQWCHSGTHEGVMEPSGERTAMPQKVEICASLSPKFGFGEGSVSPGDQRSYVSLDSRLNMSSSVAFSDLTGDFTDEEHDDLLRDINELRSENEYLKDEMEELRSEMLEMRDLYMEEDVYQLQELRLQLEQANKACRILQYRLRKAERRSLRVAQTGHVDGELIRTLEHDIRVAKTVSARLHGELEAVQKKNSQLEWENEELRERLQDLDVAKQVLQAEMDKSLNSLKRRSMRSTNKSEKKLSPQDDSADLKCQLHFAKEESALMCKKLTKMALESETMREQLTKYRLLFGEVDESQAAAGTKTSAHTREAEAKVHLRLVEEEATLLSRRIVELEVENRGLRAEMSELRERGGSFEEEEGIKGAGEADPLPQLSGEISRVQESSDEQENLIHEHVESSAFSQMHREGPIGGEQELLAENKEDAQVGWKSDCNFGVKDLEGLFAIHDQAQLVRSTIQFLTAPPKNGFASSCSLKLNPNAACLNKQSVESPSKTHQWLLDPMMSPLTSGLEVLQAQLRGFIEKMEVMLKSSSEQLEKHVSSIVDDLNAVNENTKSQATPEYDCKGEVMIWSDEESLMRLSLQLRCFLQQWRQGERPSGEQMNTFEETSSKYNLQDKCNTKTKSALVSDLKMMFEDLTSELLELRSATQCLIHQFANAKAAWAMECAGLKCLLEDPGGNPRPNGSPELRVAVQKEHNEKLQQLLAESYAAVLELSKQLKVRESSWSSERKELLQHVCLECGYAKTAKPNKSMPPSTDRMMTKEGHTKRLPLKTGTKKTLKNWTYLTREAASMDKEDTCKTWDCPIMPPSFPGINLSNNPTQRSHTAPERSAIRIYYSPPSSKRMQMSALLGEEQEECENIQQPLHKSTSCGPVNQDWIIAYENWLSSLSFDCQSLLERDSTTIIRSASSSALQNSSSQLAFNSMDVSSNLSDDMKEITYSVLQTSHSGHLERKRATDSGINVVSTGTQTQSQARVITVGLQTDGPRSLYTAKHWSPRVTSVVPAKTQQMLLSERDSCPAERFQARPTSPKLQHRLSSSSLRSSTSSSSSSFTSSSLSSTSSASASSRLHYGVKENSLWPSTTNRPSTGSVQASDKSGNPKNSGVHKYGLVQEFLRNVCGRGDKNHMEMEKAPVTRREGLESPKKPEHSSSRIPIVTVVRNDSITKIVNRRFMKQSHKEEPVSQNQNPTQCQTDKASIGRNKSLEFSADESSSHSLTFCFARASQKHQRHGQGTNKARLQKCSKADHVA
ncbi:hypothetical protein DNTS_027609 [Danionella cerebrum]|uniref:SOGA coiled-coil domain-containing protein n=1 Tax=Danionella cerebrum TaxID=2873325 RepID=A0A553QIH1_9TELE|nr:hypothetical protein DNTS_027609 [Danionella translucida]